MISLMSSPESRWMRPRFSFDRIALAIFFYLVRPGIPGRIVAWLGQVYTAVRRKYYIDEFVDATVLKLTWKLTYFQKWIDENEATWKAWMP